MRLGRLLLRVPHVVFDELSGPFEMQIFVHYTLGERRSEGALCAYDAEGPSRLGKTQLVSLCMLPGHMYIVSLCATIINR